MNILKRCTPAFFALFFIFGTTGLVSTAHADDDPFGLCEITVRNKNTWALIETYSRKNSDTNFTRTLANGSSSSGWKEDAESAPFGWMAISKNNTKVWIKTLGGAGLVKRKFGNDKGYTMWWSQRASFDTCGW